ncbi:hypothetical protein D3C81_2209680 [compost metagenome]
MLARRARLHVDQLKINRVVVHVNLGDADLHLVANAEYLGGALANERHMGFVEVIVIIAQRAEAD